MQGNNNAANQRNNAWNRNDNRPTYRHRDNNNYVSKYDERNLASLKRPDFVTGSGNANVGSVVIDQEVKSAIANAWLEFVKPISDDKEFLDGEREFLQSYAQEHAAGIKGALNAFKAQGLYDKRIDEGQKSLVRTTLEGVFARKAGGVEASPIRQGQAKGAEGGAESMTTAEQEKLEARVAKLRAAAFKKNGAGAPKMQADLEQAGALARTKLDAIFARKMQEAEGQGAQADVADEAQASASGAYKSSKVLENDLRFIVGYIACAHINAFSALGKGAINVRAMAQDDAAGQRIANNVPAQVNVARGQGEITRGQGNGIGF